MRFAPDYAHEKARRILAKSETTARGPRLGADVDDVDRADRVSQRLVVGVGIQLDHRRFARERMGDVAAQELFGADDQMQSFRILVVLRGNHLVSLSVLVVRFGSLRPRCKPDVIARCTFSTTCATRRLSDHHVGGSGRIGGAMLTSIRRQGRSASVPRTETGQIGTPAWSAKCPMPALRGRRARPWE